MALALATSRRRASSFDHSRIHRGTARGFYHAKEFTEAGGLISFYSNVRAYGVNEELMVIFSGNDVVELPIDYRKRSALPCKLFFLFLFTRILSKPFG